MSIESVYAGNAEILSYLQENNIDALELREYEEVVYKHAKQQLPPLLKQVFFLANEKQYKNKDIGRMLGISKNSVVKYKRKANEMVKQIVKKYYIID